MRPWLSLLLAASVSIAWSAAASAAPKVALAPTGRTIGGPVDTTVGAGDTETVVNATPALLSACVTLANTGNGAVNLNLVGSNGTTTSQIPVRKTAVACRAGTTSVTIQCLATGTGMCSANWRLDDASLP